VACGGVAAGGDGAPRKHLCAGTAQSTWGRRKVLVVGKADSGEFVSSASISEIRGQKCFPLARFSQEKRALTQISSFFKFQVVDNQQNVLPKAICSA